MNKNDLWLSDILQKFNMGTSEWAVCFTDLQKNETIKYNANIQMDTMSVIKIPILVCFLALCFKQEIDLNKRVKITRGDKRFGTGILALLDDDLEISLKDAAYLMVTISDNTATDLIIDSIGGFEVINAWLVTIGLSEIKLMGTSFEWFKALATFMDEKCESYDADELFAKGYPLSNKQDLLLARKEFHFQGIKSFGLATAESMNNLLQLIKIPSQLNHKVCNQVLQILSKQNSGSRIPRYLPESVNIFHKTGDFKPFIANDAGIIELESGESFAMCMFSKSNQLSWGFSEEVISRTTLMYFEKFLKLYA